MRALPLSYWLKMKITSLRVALGIVASFFGSVLISMGVFAASLSAVSGSRIHLISSSAAAHSKTEPPFEFPGGGRQLFPRYRLVALYGTPNSSRLGALGEQPLEATIERVKLLAAEHQKHTSEFVLPTLEIITTIAHVGATENNDYSREIDVAALDPWVKAARQAGVYVVIELQPGRADFLTQAKLYEPLLTEPHVGLALDPEWRLKPHQLHLRQVGTVDAAEINQTAEWLAELTRKHHLPQKLFLLQQFKLTMITNRHMINTAHEELAFAIQMDGHGGHGSKLETWNAIRRELQPEIYPGWKNFYDEDKPVLTPEATMKLAPVPWFVSYQ